MKSPKKASLLTKSPFLLLTDTIHYTFKNDFSLKVNSTRTFLLNLPKINRSVGSLSLSLSLSLISSHLIYPNPISRSLLSFLPSAGRYVVVVEDITGYILTGYAYVRAALLLLYVSCRLLLLSWQVFLWLIQHIRLRENFSSIMTLNKDWLLYLNMSKNLYVLDVSKWLDWYSNEDVKKSFTRPEFKLSCSWQSVFEFEELRYMIVNSEPYVVGGQLSPDYIVEKTAKLAVDAPFYVRCCEHTTKLPPLSAPKLDPCVLTIDGKIYVLSTRIFDGCIKDKKPPRLFEALHPGSDDWKVLPNPPFIIGRTLNSSCPFIGHYSVWGQKLIVKDPVTGKNYIFNTHEEKMGRSIGHSGRYRPLFSTVQAVSSFCRRWARVCVPIWWGQWNPPTCYRAGSAWEDHFPLPKHLPSIHCQFRWWRSYVHSVFWHL